MMDKLQKWFIFIIFLNKTFFFKFEWVDKWIKNPQRAWEAGRDVLPFLISLLKTTSKLYHQPFSIIFRTKLLLIVIQLTNWLLSGDIHTKKILNKWKMPWVTFLGGGRKKKIISWSKDICAHSLRQIQIKERDRSRKKRYFVMICWTIPALERTLMILFWTEFYFIKL